MKKENGENICMFPECKSGKALEDIHSLINATMSESNKNGKEMVGLLKDSKDLLVKSASMTVEITNVRDTLKEFKNDQKVVNDSLFTLLRDLGKTKVGKQEVVWGFAILTGLIAAAVGLYSLIK